MARIADLWFGIRVVDDATGRGVPLVELTTVNKITFVTDSNGWAAIADPGLMGGETFFHVRSHGYTFPKDGFGYAGVRLTALPGKRVRIPLRRVNIAERVCRLTGEGIYADSVLLGEATPLREPILAGKVLGQDSTLAVVYKGRMLYFWGDTDQAGYPLGNFRTTGAVATFPRGKADAESGLDFRYFTGTNGFARAMCPTDKPGPIWVFGVTTLPERGGDILIAHYSRMKDLGKRLEHGYVQWDEAREVFTFIQELPLGEQWRFLDGHPITLSENGVEYRAGGFCFPLVRVPATLPALRTPSAYDAFTCLTPEGKVMRDERGKAVYRWQKDLPPISSAREAELVKQGALRADETRFLPVDASGKPVVLHGGSVTWNPWRKKWLMIATQHFAKESPLGEIVYSESDSPTGPFQRAIKIVTHDRYTFYNPVHHPFLDTRGSQVIFFEGTYTTTFSDNPNPTPRYEYNQILYRLDLADLRLTPVRS